MKAAPGLTLVFAVAFSIALQFQLTIFASENYLGLRMNLADLLVPFAGGAILWSLLTERSRWPSWQFSGMYFWLAALSLVLILALVNGWWQFGELSRWALINKCFGWVILVGLFGAGGWLATNGREQDLNVFFKTFILIFIGVLVYQLALRFAQAFFLPVPDWLPLFQYQYLPINGSMANRNAYGFLFVTVIGFASQFYLMDRPFLSPRYAQILYFLMPAFVIFNASRAMCIALLCNLLLIAVCNRKRAKALGRLFIHLVCGALVTTALLWDKPLEVIFLRINPVEFVTKTVPHLRSENVEKLDIKNKDVEISNGVYYPGDNIRLTILDAALEQIIAHPLIGSGLGSAMMYQAQKYGHEINVIDSTPVWLLVETGIIGLLIFALFYVICTRSLFRNLTSNSEWQRAITAGVLLTVAAFSVMCVMHEIFYTRHLWFLLGLGLALPKTHPAE